MEPSRQSPPARSVRRPLACLGEAIVDLICERKLAEGEIPADFRPNPGGALANVAVAAARNDQPAALVGGVGQDGWGRWLREGLEAEGVSTRWLASLEGADTPLALVEFDREGEPSFQVYGDHIGPTMSAASGFLEAAIEGSQALVVGSNTMVGETEREVTRRAISLARAAGRPVLLDPNYRPNRWGDSETARGFCLELVGAATVVKLGRGEAELITGVADPLDAAREIASIGPGLVVITAGAGEIVTAGATEARLCPGPLEVISSLGAGDAFMGALAAGLSRSGWDLAAADELLPNAVLAAARVCSAWGAQ